MLNIVIPMAGLGSRFTKTGHGIPKPLIPIHGIPMIRFVIENIKPLSPHRFIFICQRSHVEAYGLDSKLQSWAPGSELIQIDGLTEGAACTVLAARDCINDDNPVMIANSDQFVELNMENYLNQMTEKNLDGLIMTMWADDPKWSFAALENDLVTKVVEKEVISNEATVGIYNFGKGKDYIHAADEMINRDLRVNNEFYVAPVYNILIESGYRIGIFSVGSDGHGMHGLGTPQDLDAFIAHPISLKAAQEIS